MNENFAFLHFLGDAMNEIKTDLSLEDIYSTEMLDSMKKVEASRKSNAELEPRRMTADEKDKLLETYHPDYKKSEFAELIIGPNKGEKVPLELASLLQGKSRVNPDKIDLSKPDYETDVLIIGAEIGRAHV